MLDWIKLHWKQIAAAAAVCGLFYCYHNYQTAKFEQAIQLSVEQTANVDALQSELQISKQNAEQLASEVKKAQSANTQPVTHITVTAIKPEKVTEIVREKINNNDSTLPAAALEETDRTVVSEQPENKEYPVGVYKINLNKPHKIKAGFSYIDDKPYASVGYQQNKVEVLTHLKGGQVEGVSVLYTVKEW